MTAILATILQLAAEATAAAPTAEAVITLVEQAFTAYRAQDQAGLDATHTAMTNLANSLKPPNR